MRLSQFHLSLNPFFDAPGDGAGGGGQTGATGANNTGTNTGAQAPAAGGQPNANDGQRTGAATTGQNTPPQFTYKEDRSTWIPKHRFDEVNTQAQRAQELETQLAEERRRVAALTGSQPPDPNAAKAESIKEAFFNLPGMGIFRKFASMTEEQFERLMKAPEHLDRFTSAEDQQWKRHADSQVKYIGEKIAEALGAEKLEAEDLDDLRTSFTGWLKRRAKGELETTGKSDTVRRYEDGDETLLDEFVQAHTKRWVEPARRNTTAQNINRTRPVPSSSGRAPVSTVQRPEKFNSLDERIEYASKVAQERGLRFGR